MIDNIESSFEWRQVVPIGGSETDDVTSIVFRIRQTKVIDLLSRWSPGQSIPIEDAELIFSYIMSAIKVGQQ